GMTAGARNVISGNETGISIGSGGGNVVQGNYVGTDVSGTLALGNDAYGVYVSGANNAVGGTAAGAGNTGAFNGSHGVPVEVGGGNAVRRNAILANAGLGISLAGGGNNGQGAPSVNTAVSGDGSTTALVALVSTPNTTFAIDLFSNAACDPSGFGEGEKFLGTVSLTTKATGRGRVQIVVGEAVPIAHSLTATPPTPANDTSPFSNCMVVTEAGAPGLSRAANSRPRGAPPPARSTAPQEQPAAKGAAASRAPPEPTRQ